MLVTPMQGALCLAVVSIVLLSRSAFKEWPANSSTGTIIAGELLRKRLGDFADSLLNSS